MASLKLTLLSTFGLFPKTEVIEARKKALEDEYSNFNEFEKSEELANYLSLEKNVLSAEFAENKKHIKSLQFKNTEQFKLLEEYTQLSKKNEIKIFLKINSSPELTFSTNFEKSAKKERYDQLSLYFQSEEHKKFLSDLAEQKSKLDVLLKEFTSLKNSANTKRFFKVKNSKDLANYLATRDSDKLKKYQELKSFTGSQKLKDLKDALLEQKGALELKKKRYTDLQKNAELKTYFKVLSSDELKNYQNLENSGKPEEFKKSEKIINSQEFKSTKATTKKEEWINTDFYKAELEFQNLKKNSEFIRYQKFAKSQNLTIYLKITQSDILKEFNELNSEVNTPEFSQNLASSEYKNTPEFKMEQEFKMLQKDKEIIHFLKFDQSEDMKHFIGFEKSKELERYNELDIFIRSAEYTNQLAACEYKNSDAFKDETELNNLKKDPEIVKYTKFIQSKDYAVFLKTKDSDFLSRHDELKILTTSDEFLKFKEYMLDPKKWEKSDEFAMEQEYIKLKKSEKISWYFKTKQANPFKELQKWTLRFSDEFDGSTLNKNKWMTSYFWGQMLLKDSYVLENDKHFLTEGKNLEIANSSLKIITKKEKITGKSWNPKFGFMPKEFEYTSGIVNSAHSFRQQYGKFEAKIKFHHSYPVYQAFWLKGEKIAPEIDIAKYHHKNPKTLFFATHQLSNDKIANKTVKSGGLNFNDQAYIYSLIWTPEELCWQINGVTVHRQNSQIPNEPMYIVFNSGLTNPADQAQLPSEMEIEWVRVFSKNEIN